jgi:hypothetical protein
MERDISHPTYDDLPAGIQARDKRRFRVLTADRHNLPIATNSL